jgi:hypothetical protein
VNDQALASRAESSGATSNELVLLSTPAMRARRRPWAIVGVWAWQAGLALLVSWPAASLVGAAWGGSATGDAPLWAPGGHALLDWLWHDARGLTALVRMAELVLVIGGVAGLLPAAALLISLAYATRDRRAPGLGRSLEHAVRVLPAMALLLVIAGFAQATVALLAWLLGSGIAAWTHASLGEALAQELAVASALPGLALLSAIGVAHDLARAAAVRFRTRGLRSLALGIRAFRAAPFALWWSWAWRAAASFPALVAAGAVAERLGGRGGVALVVLAALHQAVALARVALRASWLAKALRAVDGRGSNPTR